jgi:hypothetical protein
LGESNGLPSKSAQNLEYSPFCASSSRTTSSRSPTALFAETAPRSARKRRHNEDMNRIVEIDRGPRNDFKEACLAESSRRNCPLRCVALRMSQRKGGQVILCGERRTIGPLGLDADNVTSGTFALPFTAKYLAH